MKNKLRKKADGQQKINRQHLRSLLTHFFTFVIVFALLGVFMTALINVFFFRSVYTELHDFKVMVENNLREVEVDGKEQISISPRGNARISIILYQDDGEIYAFDRELLSYLLTDINEYHLDDFQKNEDLESQEILEALNHKIFHYDSLYQEFRLEKISLENDYHFQTLVFAVDNPNAPSVQACKLFIMVNGEVGSRNAMLRIYLFSALMMFVFAFFASLMLTRMNLKPLRTALNKQLLFVSNASHELRTPLAIVQNRLENILAKSNKTVYEVSSDIAISLKEISRLSKLTNDLLLLAKSDNEALEINYEEFNLYKLIEDVSTPFAEMAEIDNKNFILEGEDIVVNADRSKIAQVLIILLDNALNYTQSGESITIEISQMNNDVLIKVKDTGVGIDNLTKKHLFERFYRADKARRRETGGNGLGLSIAQTIMKLHNGRIIVSDNYPKGSYFIVQFPKNLILKKNNTPLQS